MLLIKISFEFVLIYNYFQVKFSPQRQRDTSSARISSKLGKAGAGAVFGRGLSNDNVSTSKIGSSFNVGSSPKDRHVSVYDQSNTCSLSSVSISYILNFIVIHIHRFVIFLFSFNDINSYR